jgi:glutathione S-transferase
MPHVLYTGPSSPFGRMASVVIRETGAPIEEQVIDVYAATFLDPFNPLRQIPTLVLVDGTGIYDSRVICRFAEALATRKLMAAENSWDVETRWALAVGIMEAGLQRRMESLRPDGEKSESVIGKLGERIDRALAYLEPAAALLPREQARIDAIGVAVALEYTDFRYTRGWRERCPGLGAWLASYGERPSMSETRPHDVPS